MEGIARRGLMLVLSSPSGAGKTTLARRLQDDERGTIAMSISHTTRPRRQGEKDGRDYHFIDRDTFTRMRDHNEFLEWAVVFDNFYGTTRQPVEQALAQGRDVLFDVDWQGAAALRATAPNDVVPSYIAADRGRPRAAPNERAQDLARHRAATDARASNEIQHWQDYDYVVTITTSSNRWRRCAPPSPPSAGAARG